MWAPSTVRQCTIANWPRLRAHPAARNRRASSLLWHYRRTSSNHSRPPSRQFWPSPMDCTFTRPLDWYRRTCTDIRRLRTSLRLRQTVRSERALGGGGSGWCGGGWCGALHRHSAYTLQGRQNLVGVSRCHVTLLFGFSHSAYWNSSKALVLVRLEPIIFSYFANCVKSKRISCNLELFI